MKPVVKGVQQMRGLYMRRLTIYILETHCYYFDNSWHPRHLCVYATNSLRDTRHAYLKGVFHATFHVNSTPCVFSRNLRFPQKAQNRNGVLSGRHYLIHWLYWYDLRNFTTLLEIPQVQCMLSNLPGTSTATLPSRATPPVRKEVRMSVSVGDRVYDLVISITA